MLRTSSRDKPSVVVFICSFAFNYLQGVLFEHLEIQLQQGYSRLWHEGQLQSIEDYISEGLPERKDLYLMLDRLALSEDIDVEARLGESIEQAFFDGRGACSVFVQTTEGESILQEFSNVFEADGRVIAETYKTNV